MTTYTSRTFETEDGQAVLLHDEIAYPDDTEVTIIRSGDVLTVYPTMSPKPLHSRLPGEGVVSREIGLIDSV